MQLSLLNINKWNFQFSCSSLLHNRVTPVNVPGNFLQGKMFVQLKVKTYILEANFSFDAKSTQMTWFWPPRNISVKKNYGMHGCSIFSSKEAGLFLFFFFFCLPQTACVKVWPTSKSIYNCIIMTKKLQNPTWNSTVIKSIISSGAINCLEKSVNVLVSQKLPIVSHIYQLTSLLRDTFFSSIWARISYCPFGMILAVKQDTCTHLWYVCLDLVCHLWLFDSHLSVTLATPQQ